MISKSFPSCLIYLKRYGFKDNINQEEDVIEVYSIGGGSIVFQGEKENQMIDVYKEKTMSEILKYVEEQGKFFL